MPGTTSTVRKLVIVLVLLALLAAIYLLRNLSSGVVLDASTRLPLSGVHIIGTWEVNSLHGSHCAALDVDITGVAGTYKLRRPGSWHMTTARPYQVFAFKPGYIVAAREDSKGEKYHGFTIYEPIATLEEVTHDPQDYLEYLVSLVWRTNCSVPVEQEQKRVPFLMAVMLEAQKLVDPPTPYQLYEDPERYEPVKRICREVAEAAVRELEHPTTAQMNAKVERYLQASLPSCQAFFAKPVNRRLAQQSPLMTASRDTIEALLASGYTIDEKFRGLTSFASAVAANRFEIARLLLEFGADPDALQQNGRTPLHAAIQASYVRGYASNTGRPYDSRTHWNSALPEARERIAFLLEVGADPMRRDVRKVSPLLSAIHADQHEAVEMMLKAGADVNQREIAADGKTVRSNPPLMQVRSARMTTLLLEYGADPHLPGQLGRTPLIQAAVSDTDSVAPLLAAGADINAVDEAGGTALLYAVHIHNRAQRPADRQRVLARIKYLLEQGADTSIRNKSGETVHDLVTDEQLRKLLAGRDRHIEIEPHLQRP